MNKEFLQSLREQIKSGTVTEQEPMSRHTSFSIGGPADVFVQPATKEEIKNAKQGFLFLLWVTVVTCWYPMKVFGE